MARNYEEDRVYETERRFDEKNRPVMYVKKTAMVPWGGALLIVAGALNIIAGIGATAGGAAIDDFFDITGAIFAGIPMLVTGLIILAAGIIALSRMAWGFVLFGGILAVLPSAGWLFGVPGLILISIAKPEFDFRRQLEEKPVRAAAIPPAVTEIPAARAATAPRMATAEATPIPLAGTMRLQGYLTGMDYPANKNELSIFAKTNGAPSQVLMYMNKLPNREYRSPVDVENEFSKIK